MKLITIFMMVPLLLRAQLRDSCATKGSYLFYGQPSIEDNSMYVDEAFNQPEKVVQQIITCEAGIETVQFGYNAELPLKSNRHQLSASMSYHVLRQQMEKRSNTWGPGDLVISYRGMLFNKNDIVLLTPGISISIPVDNSDAGFGKGAFAAEAQIAVTKRWSKRIVTHFNQRLSIVFREHFRTTTNGMIMHARWNSLSWKQGTSIIWLTTDRINLMLEYQHLNSENINHEGSKMREGSAILNPGARFLIKSGRTEFVPAIGVPLIFAENQFIGRGVFVQLSIECF